MNKSVKKKIVFIAIIIFAVLMLLNLKVFAADEKFKLEKEEIDVSLNGAKYVSYSGGTGKITWESNDTSIATVTDDGKIEAKKIGTTTITATRGEEIATCTVNVVYYSLTLSSNYGNYITEINLILDEHSNEKLNAVVKDGKYEVVEDASVTWTSSDKSVATIDENGVVTALKPGTTTITADVPGVSENCKVVVYSAPKFTDFSKAKYETTFDGYNENLKITGIIPQEEHNYYYIITPTNKKPEISKYKDGYINEANCKDTIEDFSVNSNENYIYTGDITKYAELNNDMYIWIVEGISLKDGYYDNVGNYIHYTTKFLVEGEKLKRADLPQLNLILQTFSIGSWTDKKDNTDENHTYIRFKFPSETENRKFTLKIGKITDVNILQKIQKGDYTGIKELLTYAKSHNSIYSKKLTTTDVGYFSSEETLFDGRNLLENKGYYYVYVEFDDENGKYYPIEGVTLGQAWISDTNNKDWDLWAYTSGDFKWDNLTVTETKIAVTGVKLNKATIEEGKSVQLNATIEPADASNKKLTWKSSNEKVAKVDEKGNVTGVAAGTATITVTTEDGGKTATCEVTVTKAKTPDNTTGNTTTNNTTQNTTTNNTAKNTTGGLPFTGAGTSVIIGVAIVAIIGTAGYIKYRQYKEV